MIPLLAVHGADDGQLVHMPRHPWKRLGDLNPGHVGRDRFEIAVGLGIPHVHVGRTAGKPDENDRLGLLARTGAGGGQRVGEPEVIAQRNAKERQAAHPEELTPLKVASGTGKTFRQVHHDPPKMMLEKGLRLKCPNPPFLMELTDPRLSMIV